MIKPQYVRDISDVYTKMYNHPGEERPLVLQEKALDVKETPKWKKILRGAALEQNRKEPPYAGHSEPRESATEEEEHTNQDVGVGSDFMNKYLDGLEAKNQSADHQAQEYLESVIDDVPTAVGGVNIHRVIKDAFIAGTNAR